ncbi:hypothetical protein TTRE_0000076601 [Trichuris trichiura]|uniref:Uncharacterized protein n=1 Tax=Trichuris trichiura TaxID=36087 RepID=A0A077YXJ4_TRITR|nr:hypothetical protein TTRE_0000076601 [Trichuris trichiura]
MVTVIAVAVLLSTLINSLQAAAVVAAAPSQKTLVRVPLNEDSSFIHYVSNPLPAVAVEDASYIDDRALLTTSDAAGALHSCYNVFTTQLSAPLVAKAIVKYRSEGYVPIIGHPYYSDYRYHYYRLPSWAYLTELNKAAAAKKSA